MPDGLEGVVATSTRLSHVDGEAGRLTLAGYAVEDLAPRASFEDVAHLFLRGRRPARALPRRDRGPPRSGPREHVPDGRLANGRIAAEPGPRGESAGRRADG